MIKFMNYYVATHKKYTTIREIETMMPDTTSTTSNTTSLLNLLDHLIHREHLGKERAEGGQTCPLRFLCREAAQRLVRCAVTQVEDTKVARHRLAHRRFRANIAGGSP